VPHFFDSTISLRNVFISRRPKDTYPSRPPIPKSSTSSSSIFSILHRGSSSPPSQHSDDDEDAVAPPIDEDEDTNYSMFDLNVDSIDVTLSFVSWLNGEGLVKRAVVRGVRGVIGEFLSSLISRPTRPRSPFLSRAPVRWVAVQLTSPCIISLRPSLSHLGPCRTLDPFGVAPSHPARRRILPSRLAPG
jgi:distribution and morphology protein 31